MTASLHLPFTIYRLAYRQAGLPFISHWSFARQTAVVNCKLLTDNSLKIENCELRIASEGGV